MSEKTFTPPASIDRHNALDHALAALRKLKPESFEIYVSRQSRTSIEARDGKIDSLTRAEDVGLSVRLIHQKRMGFSFTTSLNQKEVERAVQSAFDIAQAMPEDPFVGFEKLNPENYRKFHSKDQEGLDVAVEKKIALALELENLCRKSDSRIKGIRGASISETFAETCLVDTQGTRIFHPETLFTASVTCKAEHEGDSQMGGDYEFAQKLKNLKIEKVAQNAAEYACELLGAQPAPTLQCPAVLRNNVVSELIEFLSSSFSAEQIDKGRSLLAGKEGQKIFSPQIHLLDDGLLEGGYATGPFDSEGVPARQNILVENGVFKGALYDGYYARKKQKTPSGTASRGIKSPPSIGFTNLIVRPGQHSLSQLIQDIDRGVMITDLMGVHTANPVTGDFSLGASGILIEKGKLTRPIKGFAVAGNLLELFNRITDIGNDQRFFGSLSTPSVRVSEISVGGS